MEKITAAKDLYLNADKTVAIPHGPDAAFLLIRAGRQVPARWTHLVTRNGNPKRPPKATTKEVKPGEDK